MRARSVAHFPPKYSGFIFCGIFSNLGATGCRRGRTPERPLRQPSKVWLIKPGLSCSWFRVWPRRTHGPRLTDDRALKGHKLISQTVALRRRLPLRWKAARFRFVIKRAGAERQGEGLRRHPMCLLRSRVRSPSSAGRALCRERPGRSGGGGTSGSLSRQAKRESRG
jgi:hypothetical protein